MKGNGAPTGAKNGFWQTLAGFFRRDTAASSARRRLNACRASLLAVLASPVLPVPLLDPVRELARHCSAFAEYPDPDETAPFLDTLESLAKRAKALTTRQTAWNAHTAELYARMGECAADLRLALEERARAAARNDANTETAAARARIQEAAALLADKTNRLPESMRPFVAGMGDATAKLLDWTENNPAKSAHPHKFLVKYLTAANAALEEYLRLAANGVDEERLAELTARLHTLLPRLEAAFAQEYQGVLRNDTLRLAASLQTLDVLLKMDGRGDA